MIPDLWYPLYRSLKCRASALPVEGAFPGGTLEHGFDSLKKVWGRAALCLMVAVAATMAWTLARPEPVARSSAVADALGQYRFIEPRFSGGFAYAPCQSVREPGRLIPTARCSEPPAEGTTERRELEKALGRIVNVAEHGPVARRLAANVRLVWPEDGNGLDTAVDQLQQLADASPKDPVLLNDLAAARFELAIQEDEPAELIRALAAAETAYRIHSILPELCFNRALILDRLYLRDQAEAAWNDYLKLDSDSAWAGEARKRLTSLRAPSPVERWKQSVDSLESLAQAGDAKAVREIVALAPEKAREHAVEQLLGRWGDSIVARQKKAAEKPLHTARMMGDALLAIVRDPTVAEAVQAVDRATAGPRSDEALANLARGFQAYRDGIGFFRKQQIEEAAPRLEAARASMASSGSPIEIWALYGLAGIEGYRSRFAEAIRAFRTVAARASALGSQGLQGRAELGIGWAFLRGGQFSESLSHHQEAAKLLVAGRETEGLAGVDDMIAESLRFLGQSAAAWRYRYQAAQELWGYRDSIRLHNLSWESGRAAVEDGLAAAALLIQDEGIGVAERSKEPMMVAEALAWRSKIYLALRNPRTALVDLAEARRRLASSEDGLVKQRVAMDIAYAEGEAMRLLDARAAIQPLTQALDFYRKNNLFLDQAGAYLSLARAFLACGREKEAEANLVEAINLFESQRAKVTDNTSRLSYSEAAQGLFDEMILLNAERRGDSEAALAMSERARAVSLAGFSGMLAEPAPVEEALGEIPADTVLLEYAQVSDNLFIWGASRGKVEFVRRDISTAELNGLVQKFVTGIQNRIPQDRLSEISSRLHDLLIPQEWGIQPGAKLCFIPDKRLNSIPFGALWDAERRKYLIEDHTVRIVPSLAFYKEKRAEIRRSQGKALAALLVGANQWNRDLFRRLEPLPGVAREITEIRALYHDPQVIEGMAATRERFLNELDQYDVVQFAGHAVFNPRHPEHSYLVLAPSPGDTGALFASEIAGRHFSRLSLVILAACSTLGPLDSRTSGLSGLARPFLDAGATAVVGTLWDTRDAEAERLLPDFHRWYLKSRNAAESLRSAQLAALRSTDPTSRAPATWAGFQVVGITD